MRETELKFALPVSFAVPPFNHDQTGVAVVEKLAPQRLRATYYDTPDLRLARNGVTLRYRTGEEEPSGWQLKLPVDGPGAWVRDELHLKGVRRRVPDEALDLVTAFARTEKLGPVASLGTRRRRWRLKDDAGEELAEIMDDEVSVLEGRRVVACFRELELENRAPESDVLEPIAAALRAAGAVDSEPIPKVVRALGPPATSPPDPSERVAVGPGDPASTAVKAALVNGVRRLISHDVRARLGEPEGVHQVRVAARRMRSDLRTFKELVEPQWAEELTAELKWLAEALGKVRDLDVLQERLRCSAGDLQGDLGRLFESLERAHAEARAGLLQTLGSDRYKELLDKLVAAATAPEITEAASARCEDVLPGLVKNRWKRLARDGRSLSVDDPVENWHAVRIRAKRARYAAEAVAPALGSRRGGAAKRFAKQVAGVQEVLGDHQDASVAQEIISDIDEARAGTPYNFAAGRLFERQSQEMQSRRVKFFELWDELDRKRHRRWLKT